MDILDARSIVGNAQGKTRLFKASGITSDIIAAIIQQFHSSYWQTEALARQLRKGTNIETLEAVWAFARNNIRYQLDTKGLQQIPTPARVLSDGEADCKGLTILVTSILKNLGYKASFRFVSYSTIPTVTHIYTIVDLNGKQFVLDACMPGFNMEKPYTYKEDYNMSRIEMISGIGSNGSELLPTETPLNLTGNESEEMLDLLIERQSKEIDLARVSSVYGIGSAIGAEIATEIDLLNAAIEAERNGDAEAIEGIGSTAESIGRIKLGNAIKKVDQGIKKATTTVAKGATTAVKAAAKVVTFVPRLIIKEIAEISLPKAAPAFLYLFITNPTTVSKLPSKVQRKRNKAQKFRNFMINIIGMKESQFMGLVRNGIKRKFGAEPEEILKSRVQGPINGYIGAGPAAAAAAAPQMMDGLVKIIEALAKAFGKRPSADEALSSSDLPDLENDFEGITTTGARMLTANMQMKPTALRSVLPTSRATTRSEVQREMEVMQQLQAEPANVPLNAPLPLPTTAVEPTTAVIPTDTQSPGIKPNLPSWVLPVAGVAVVGVGMLVLNNSKPKKRK